MFFNKMISVFIITILTILKASCTAGISIEVVSPSPNNTFASDFVGLTLRAQYPKSNYQSCYWYAHQLVRVEMFSLFVGCANRDLPTAYLTCQEEIRNGDRIITTSVRYTEPIIGDLNVTIFCNDRIIGVVPFITVRDCTASPLYQVESNQASYNSVGSLDCAGDGKLFYSNGTQANSAQSTCGSNAIWTVPDDIKCWNAPVPSITSNLEVTEGNTLRVYCTYDDVLPIGYSTIFVYDGVSYERPKGQPLIISSLNRLDNNKSISCKAVTPFTTMFSNTGRSTVKNIQVLYAPYFLSTRACHWLKNYKQSCVIFFNSNPSVKFESLTKDGVIVDGFKTIAKSKEDGQAFIFEKDNVTLEDAGMFTVAYYSSFYGARSFTFQITVFEAYPVLSRNDKSSQSDSSEIFMHCVPLYVPVIVAAVCAIAIAFLTTWLIKTKRLPEKTDIESTNAISHSREIVYENPADVITQEKPRIRSSSIMRKNELYELNNYAAKQSKSIEETRNEANGTANGQDLLFHQRQTLEFDALIDEQNLQANEGQNYSVISTPKHKHKDEN